jgi:CHAD domain-containing protein
MGPDDAAQRRVATVVRKQWRALRRAVRDAGPNPNGNELHQIRIKAKRLRYASEAAAPLVGKPARRTAKAAEALQTMLGEHHDAVAAEHWLSRDGLQANDRTAFVAGKLVGKQRWRQMEVSRQWRGSWEAVRKQAKRWPA